MLMTDFHALDAVAAGRVTDADLGLPTRCAGWSVKDLIAHMNDEYEAILKPLLGTVAIDSDVRTAFDRSAGGSAGSARSAL